MDYPERKSARATGNEFAHPGDLEIELLSGETVYLELKASDSKAGTGTAANITQDALTSYGLVPDAQPWSKWRQERAFDQNVIALLDEFEPARSSTRRDDKGRIVREHAREGDPGAKAVKAKVAAYADADRKAYLKGIEDLTVDPEAVRFLAFAVVMGAHTAAEIGELEKRGVPTSPDEVPSEYAVYFTNLRPDGSIGVRTLGRDAVVALLSVSDFELELGNDDRATCRVVGRLDGERVEILRFILHWKNVFLGIKTPCTDQRLPR